MSEHAIDRIGIGTDVHRLKPGGPLRLGGIDIPFDRSATGHSDGDVLLHAVIDAICGAAGLPDIGDQFSDTDPRHKDCDSRDLLLRVVERAVDLGYTVVNVDVVIQAERPKLSPYKAAIRKSVADMLGRDSGAVSIKAKTNEGLDAVGRGEAIACVAVVGLRKRLMSKRTSAT